MRKIKIYRGWEVRENRGMNSAGGIEYAIGIEYYFAEDVHDIWASSAQKRMMQKNYLAGILFNSVGPDGDSTGIFSSMRGTAIDELVEIVPGPPQRI